MNNVGNMFVDWRENVFFFGQGHHSLSEWLLMVLSVLAIASICWLVYTLKQSVSNIRNTSLRPIFIFTWIYGFLVYDIGMYTGNALSFITNAPLAVLYAFKIFLLDSDISEIHDEFHANWLFSGNFALVHFLAACVTALFVIKHFGYNLIARFKMWKAGTCFGRTINDIYVFWGFNDAAYNLAESINNHYGAGNSNYRIVVIRTNKDDDDSPESRTGFNRILDFLSMKNSELDKMQKISCLTTSTYTDMARIECDDIQKGAMDILGGSFRLKLLRKILKNKVRSKIHILFLSDNEEENLYGVSLVSKDRTLNDFAYKAKFSNGDTASRQVIFYCQARYNSIHRVIEDQNPSERLSVRIVDPSHINVEMLKQNEQLIPVNFVDVEADGTVSSPFNALVVGFSEVGLDSVRFLYEFGAFVKTGSTNEHVIRSDFHLHVVDKHMADLAGTFVANAPSIKPSMPFIGGKNNPDALITLHQMDCHSVRFYLQLEEWIKTLNYIVIATDDDELNVSLGVRIFKMAVRYCLNINNLCILVRVHRDDGRFSEIVSHYNRLWLAQEAVQGVEGKDYHQKSVTFNTEAVRPIYLFGVDEKTYTYENIIDDSVRKRAIEFKERYELSSNPFYKKPTCDQNMAWYDEFRDRMHLDEEYKNFYPSYCGLMGLRRMQGQNIANCLHSLTKCLLASKAISKAGIPEFDWSSLSRKFESIDYYLISGGLVNPLIIRILDVLAQTEHLRWCASHEILGYELSGKPNYRHEVKMHHACMTAWENLSSVIQSYDYNVVDVTLNILNPEHPIQR